MDFFRIKQSPVAAEFCHNIHDIRRFLEFHDRRIACKNRCFHIFKFILERIGCVTGLNDGLLSGFSVNNDSMIGRMDAFSSASAFSLFDSLLLRVMDYLSLFAVPRITSMT